jgi:recombination protein RecR
MPPRMLPIASPRLWLRAAVKVIAISGRLVAIASRISPPSAWPQAEPRREHVGRVREPDPREPDRDRGGEEDQDQPGQRERAEHGSGFDVASASPRYAGVVFSPSVDNLVAQLTRLPGVGQRTAQRLAFHLLRVPKDEALALAHALEEVKERIRFCNECGNLTEEETCEICRDARRDRAIVCVVEQPADLISVERTHEFRGLYHVLGGALSPLDGVEPEHLRIDELLGRVERNGVEEVVLATNPNMTGEATAAYLADRLRGRVRVTRLASGLPVGADLEYADEVTLGRALSGRREM